MNLNNRWVPMLLLGIIALLNANTLADGVYGVAHITSQPSGATVYINGTEYGTTPLQIEMRPGRHEAILTLDGYPPERRILKIMKGRTTGTGIRFEKRMPKSGIRVHNTRNGGTDSGPGTVTVATDPPALTVFMNGVRVPKTTPVAFDIQAGIYQLRIEQKGMPLLKKTVFVRAGRTVNFKFDIKPRREIDTNDPWS